MYIRIRVFLIIGSLNVFGSFLVMLILFVFLYVFYEKNIKKRIYYLVVLILMIVCFGFIFLRGVWFVFLFLMFFFGFFIDKKVLGIFFVIFVLVFILVFLIVMRVFYMLSFEYVKSSVRVGRIVCWIKVYEILI